MQFFRKENTNERKNRLIKGGESRVEFTLEATSKRRFARKKGEEKKTPSFSVPQKKRIKGSRRERKRSQDSAGGSEREEKERRMENNCKKKPGYRNVAEFSFKK